MAFIKTLQIQCDNCGEVHDHPPSAGEDALIVAAISEGWRVQYIPNRKPDGTMVKMKPYYIVLCYTCAHKEMEMLKNVLPFPKKAKNPKAKGSKKNKKSKLEKEEDPRRRLKSKFVEEWILSRPSGACTMVQLVDDFMAEFASDCMSEDSVVKLINYYFEKFRDAGHAMYKGIWVKLDKAGCVVYDVKKGHPIPKQ